MAGYSVVVKDSADRIARISAEKTTPLRMVPMIIRDKEYDLPVVRIPLDLPIYRMRNWRTDIEQLEYTRKHHLSETYFQDADENIEAQMIQHTILLRMSKDTDAPIYQELERVGKQTEPLLVTTAGVMVNGNRRLAAMRDLYSADNTRFSTFSNVDVMILPETVTEQDIELLEDDLQLAPDFRQEYYWVSRRRKLRHEVNVLKIPREEIKRHYRFKRDEDMNRELAQLDLVDEYLDTYVKSPKSYLMVEDSLQMFQDLELALEGKPPAQQQLAKAIAFPLIKESRNLGSRAYDYRIAFGKDMNEVLTVVATQEGLLAKPEQKAETKEEIVDDLFAGLGNEGNDGFGEVKEWLSDPAKSENIAQTIVAVCKSVKSGKKEEERKHAALKSVTCANTDLNSIDLSQSDPSDLPAVKAQLTSILSTAKRLMGQTEKLLK